MNIDENKSWAYIFDIDGTLAFKGDRNPYDYTKVGEDMPNTYLIDLLMDLAFNNHIIIMTGRPTSCRKETEEWLQANNVHYEDLYMRETGDKRKDYIVKRELFDKHIAGKYNVMGVFDDRNQVVDMWRGLGLQTYQVNYGNF